MKDILTTALQMLQISQDPLNTRFFSYSNLDTVQVLLRASVKQALNVTISRQDDLPVIQVMVSVYNTSGRAYDPEQLDLCVQELNQMTVSYLSPQVVTAIKQHVIFLQQSSSPPQLMQRPISSSIAGTNTLDLRQQM